MSVVSVTTVHKCDCCGRIVTLITDRDYARFEANWYEGFMVDFCVICRFLAVNHPRIAEDRRDREKISRLVTRLTAPAPKEEYAR